MSKKISLASIEINTPKICEKEYLISNEAKELFLHIMNKQFMNFT